MIMMEASTIYRVMRMRFYLAVLVIAEFLRSRNYGKVLPDSHGRYHSGPGAYPLPEMDHTSFAIGISDIDAWVCCMLRDKTGIWLSRIANHWTDG